MNYNFDFFDIFIYILLSFFLLFIFFNYKTINISLDFLKTSILKNCFKNKMIARIILNIVQAFLIAFMVVIIIQKFYIGNYYIPSESMSPTFKNKDRIFGNIFIYKFKRPKIDDIIIFKETLNNKYLFTKRILALYGDTVEIKGETLYINGVKNIDRIYKEQGLIKNKKWIIPKKNDFLEISLANDFNLEEILDIYSYNESFYIEKLSKIKFYINGFETGPLLDVLNYTEVLEELRKNKKIKIKLMQNYYFVLGDNTSESIDSRYFGFVPENNIRAKVFLKFWPINSIERF